jgi:hypothetical protein
VDQVCNRFEAAWKAGTPPRLEDFLADTAGQRPTPPLPIPFCKPRKAPPGRPLERSGRPGGLGSGVRAV